MRSILVAIIAALVSFWPASEVEAATLLAVIPYRTDGTLIMLPLRVNDSKTVWFCFDSGARHTVLDPRLSDLLGLKPISTGTEGGTGKGAVAMAHLAPVTIGLAGPRFRVDDPWTIDLSHVPIAKDTRGLIGFDLVERFVTRIDPVAHTLTLFDSKSFVPGQETAIPLIAKDGRLFIDATLDVKPGLTVTHRLRVDTGSEDSVSDAIVGEASQTRRTVLGKGLGADYEGRSGIYDAVHLGPYTWRHVWGPGGQQPAVGMEILRRFVVTFDLAHGKLYLQPTKTWDAPIPAPA